MHERKIIEAKIINKSKYKYKKNKNKYNKEKINKFIEFKILDILNSIKIKTKVTKYNSKSKFKK